MSKKKYVIKLSSVFSVLGYIHKDFNPWAESKSIYTNHFCLARQFDEPKEVNKFLDHCYKSLKDEFYPLSLKVVEVEV